MADDLKIIDPIDFIGTLGKHKSNEQTKKLVEDLRKMIEEGDISQVLISPHRQSLPRRRNDNPWVRGAEIRDTFIDDIRAFESDVFRREIHGQWVEGDDVEVEVLKPRSQTIPLHITFKHKQEGEKGTKAWDEAKVRLERRGPPSEAPWLPHTDEEIEREAKAMINHRSFLGHMSHMSWHGDRSNRLRRRLGPLLSDL